MDGMAEVLYGYHAKVYTVNDINKCQDICDGKSDCGSIAYCPETHDAQSNCFLYTKILSGSELVDTSFKDGCTSYYKRCTSRGK